MTSPCMCGDLCCSSCGPAQGNNCCDVCGAWDSDGGCEDPEECARKAQEIGAAEERAWQQAEKDAAEYWQNRDRYGSHARPAMQNEED